MTRFAWMTALLVGTLVAQPAMPAAQVKPETALRAAMETETVKGDLKAAIEQYRKVAQGSNRAIAATALLRMAECYQKLGDTESNRIYERIVREFADQREAVALARTRLAGNPTTQGTVDRVVKAGETITYGEGRVSPDGRFISYVDDWFTGNLLLHDLSGGPDRALTTSKDWGVGSAYSSTFSPDGKQIAFGWRTFGRPAVNELRVMRVDAVGLEQSRRLATSPEVDVYDATDWSADGKWLAVTLRRKDRTKQIGVVSVQDGLFRPLKTTGWRGPNKVFFSPDGKYLVYDLPASDGEAQRDLFILAIDGTRETRAVEHSANDVVMAWTRDGARVLFASDRTGAVALWAVPVFDGKPSGAPVLLKPDIGTVASFGLTASGVLHVLRNADTVGLHIAPIDLEAGRLTGPPVLESFRSDRPDWSRDGKQLAYGVRNASDQRVLMIRSLETGRVRELKPRLGYFPEPRWAPDGRSFITGGRDFQGRDGIYRIDAQSGNETFIAESGQSERVQISPDGQKIYYTTEGNSVLVERDLGTGALRPLFRPRVRVGAADLSPDGRYVAVAPLDWEAKTSALVLVPVGGGEPRTVFEVSKPDAVSTYGGTTWTGDSTALVVVKSDERYGAKEMWLVPVNGTKPRKLDIDVRSLKGLGAAGGIRLHPSGKQIAFFLGSQYREVWALESLQSALKAK